MGGASKSRSDVHVRIHVIVVNLAELRSCLEASTSTDACDRDLLLVAYLTDLTFNLGSSSDPVIALAAVLQTFRFTVWG